MKLQNNEKICVINQVTEGFNYSDFILHKSNFFKNCTLEIYWFVWLFENWLYMYTLFISLYDPLYVECIECILSQLLSSFLGKLLHE